jgi:hypothetical protein
LLIVVVEMRCNVPFDHDMRKNVIKLDNKFSKG